MINIDKILLEDWNDEEFTDNLIDLFENFRSKFIIKIPILKWKKFIKFIKDNNISINRRGIDNFTKYLTKCDYSIYLYVKEKDIDNSKHYHLTYYTDKGDIDKIFDDEKTKFYNINNESVMVRLLN